MSPIRLVIAVLVLGVLVLGYAWWARQPERALGNHGQAVADVGQDCATVRVEKDGLRFSSQYGAPSADGPWHDIPEEWRGRSVPGTLEVTEVHASDDMVGRFTADEGGVVYLPGGDADEGKFEMASCPGWAGGF